MRPDGSIVGDTASQFQRLLLVENAKDAALRFFGGDTQVDEINLAIFDILHNTLLHISRERITACTQ